eukprot:m.1779 g.1779  ORF g.1779 m.1779 type:complete len:329 (+) comp7831_c0_seq1:46-1032(+)
MTRFSLLWVFLCVFPASAEESLIEGLYCGKENCYDVLEITRDVSKSELGKAYRRLARKYHPDRNKAPKAEEKFFQIANAYEILKDEEARRDYDYMLDNPEEYYSHYYRYYKHRVAPQVDVRVVIAGVITVVSIFQYLHRTWRYNEAIKYLLEQPKYRNKAVEVAKQKRLMENIKRHKRPKEEIRAEEDAILREVIAETVDIKGGYSKPQMQDVLWVRILLSPYHFLNYVWWLILWQWRYNYKGVSFAEEDRLYLTRRALKMTLVQWESLEEKKQIDFAEKSLWIPENYTAHTKEQEEETRVKNAGSSKFRRYRRFMKNYEPGPIMDDD